MPWTVNYVSRGSNPIRSLENPLMPYSDSYRAFFISRARSRILISRVHAHVSSNLVYKQNSFYSNGNAAPRGVAAYRQPMHPSTAKRQRRPIHGVLKRGVSCIRKLQNHTNALVHGFDIDMSIPIYTPCLYQAHESGPCLYQVHTLGVGHILGVGIGVGIGVGHSLCLYP